MNKRIPSQSALLKDIIIIIEQGKQQLAVQVNSALTMVFWQVGQRINADILQNERADYGKQIINSIAIELVKQYGKSFKEKNLRRMMQFAQLYPNLEIVVSLTRQLTWTHIITLLPIKSTQARAYYAQKIVTEKWTTRFTRQQIERKAFERSEIANSQLLESVNDRKTVFKDPYFLDVRHGAIYLYT